MGIFSLGGGGPRWLPCNLKPTSGPNILAPESWSIEKTVTEFNTTEYKVKESRKLKKEKGILPEPKEKAGKTLSKDVEKKVK